MEVIPSRGGGGGSIPFQRHNVEEWSRLDKLTGMLEHARVETDHWAANTSSSSHKYGKVVDSRARNLADGSVQQRQRKQMEVFQAQVPGGSFQVIRTQSVTSTSSSWRSDKNSSTDFENLQLSVNPLDLSPQKSKASIGRSGSIGSRRPPSRPRSGITKLGNTISEEHTSLSANKKSADGHLSEVSKLCQQIHEEAKKNVLPTAATPFKNFCSDSDTASRVNNTSGKYGSNSNKFNGTEQVPSVKPNGRASSDSRNFGVVDGIVSNGFVHTALTRQKSCSTEDLQNCEIQDNTDNEESRMLSDWKRYSKVRRSLQFPPKTNHLDFIPSGNVSKLRKELEEGNKLGAMKNTNSNSELSENSINHNVSEENKTTNLKEDDYKFRNHSLHDKSENGYEPEGFSRRISTSKNPAQKRHSFVTVESLKEVRGRLKRLSSPLMDRIEHLYHSKNQLQDEDDSDDGIVTEDPQKTVTEIQPLAEVPTSYVKSYVYGMEAKVASRGNMQKQTGGTGSLESRMSSRSSSSSGSRTEEWYNRRKSYGFEQVLNDQNDKHSQSIFQDKNRVESSTDSGICRSSEAVASSSWSLLNSRCKKMEDDEGNILVNHSIQIKKPEGVIEDKQYKRKDIDSNTQKGRRTIVTLGTDCESSKLHVNDSNRWTTSQTNAAKHASVKSIHRLSEPVTVTIPVVANDSNVNGISLKTDCEWKKSENTSQNGNEYIQRNESKSLAERRERLLKHTALQEAGSQLGIWSGRDGWTHPSKRADREVKRHSIAVDECKYVSTELKNYSFPGRVIKNAGLQTESSSNSTKISNFERNNSYSTSTKEAVAYQDEIDPTLSPSVGLSQNGVHIRPISSAFDDEDCDESSMQNSLTGRKQKKVEFCKTEVHFAAEPGRFNIVETDEKPPPTNMFRRRRRNTNVTLTENQISDASRGNLPEIRFGDSLYEKKLLGVTEQIHQIAVSFENNKTNGMSLELDNKEPTRPLHTFQDDADKEDNIYTQANATILTPPRQEMGSIVVHSDIEGDSLLELQNSSGPGSPDSVKPRSILKNYRKPRPFHLGEMNEDYTLNEKLEITEDPEKRWGVRLKPVQNRDSLPPSPSMWRSTVMLQNTTFEDQQQHQDSSPSVTMLGEETELQKLLKSLRPTTQRKSTNDIISSHQSSNHSPEPVSKSVEIKISSVSPIQKPTWSVAERVRQVEDMKNTAMETRGYSTRVNFAAGETTVIESGSSDDHQNPGPKKGTPLSSLYQQNSNPKSTWLHREERKQEAMLQCGPIDGTSTFKIEGNNHNAQQRSVRTTNLQSYSDSNRLRSVETLVSTRSGHPKITSISLHYEGDEGTELGSHDFNRNLKYFNKTVPSSTRYDANFRTLQPLKKNNFHITEPVPSPSSLVVLPSSGEAYRKPSDEKEPLLNQETGFKASDLSFTQLPKDASQTYSGISHHTKFTSDERQYENISSRSTKQNEDLDKHSSSLSKRRDIPTGCENKIAPLRSNNKFETYSKSKKPELNSVFPSNSNRRSQSPVENKTATKDQHKKPFNPVLSPQQQNSSTLFGTPSLESEVTASSSVISSRVSSLEVKKARFRIKQAEVRKEASDHGRVLSRDNQSHRDERNNQEVEEEINQDSKKNKIVHAADTSSHKRSRSPNKRELQKSRTQKDSSNSTIESKREKSPVYENLQVLARESPKKSYVQTTRADSIETESAILEELTRAADQILQAVNGYTDEDSYKASSDDDFNKDTLGEKRRRGKKTGQMRKPSAKLGTISETPSAKKQDNMGTNNSDKSHKTNSNSRRNQRVAKVHLGPTSSTSSIESFTREVSRTSSVQNRTLRQEQSGNDEERKRKLTMSSAIAKSGSRTARLLQRASSRELLLQTYASSSEDIGSGVETGSNRKPTAPRRTRVHKTDSATVNTKKASLSSSAQQSPSGRGKRDSATMKPKERSSGSTSKMVPVTRKSSAGDSGDQLQVSRLKTRGEDGHQRGTSRSARKDSRHNTQGGSSPAVESSSRDRGERSAVSSRHAVSRSSASCVVYVPAKQHCPCICS